jgi:polysaccharide deacetylase 2 family uncharacterized protein YibQ
MDEDRASEDETQAPASKGLPDWAMTSLVGLILAFGLTVVLGQLRPASSQSARPTPRLVSIAEVEKVKSELASRGLQLDEREEGLHLVPLHESATPLSAIPDKPPTPAVPLHQRARIAIVIDDLGLKQNASLRATELPGPLTLAFLPYGENLQALADNGRAHGHQIIVHLPMQGAATSDPGPHALLTDLPQAELQKRILWNLSRFTGYVGINNHMGSQFTENAPDMKLVFDELASRKLFYLDSRTTAKSAARTEALADNVPYAERDVFLDNDQEASYVALQLAEAEVLAKRHGTAIAIGHPHDVTLRTLEKWIPTLAAKGIELVPVSVIIADRATPMWRQVAYRGR